MEKGIFNSCGLGSGRVIFDSLVLLYCIRQSFVLLANLQKRIV